MSTDEKGNYERLGAILEELDALNGYEESFAQKATELTNRIERIDATLRKVETQLSNLEERFHSFDLLLSKEEDWSKSISSLLSQEEERLNKIASLLEEREKAEKALLEEGKKLSEGALKSLSKAKEAPKKKKEGMSLPKKVVSKKGIKKKSK